MSMGRGFGGIKCATLVATLILFPSLTLSQTRDSLDINLVAADVDVPESIHILLGEIELLEASEDSFDPRIGELSFELGMQLASLGLNEQALEAFQRSDQSMKIREGLYSENREIPVRKIYEQYLELHNWDDASSSLNTIAWIKARNYDSSSLEYVDVLQELTYWSLAEDALNPDNKRATHLIAAHDNLEKIFDIYDINEQPLDNETLELVVAVNHRLAMHGVLGPNLETLKESQTRRQFDVSTRSCETLFVEAEEALGNCSNRARRHILVNTPESSSGIAENQTLANTQQLSPLQEFYSSQNWSVNEIDNSIEIDTDPMLPFYSQSYRRGKELLLDQLDALRIGDDHAATLDSLLALGDWYLLFGYLQSAIEVYTAAWNFASQEGLEEMVNMQPPAAISLAALADNLPRLKPGNRDGYAKFSLAVAPTGEVQSVDIIETDIEDVEVVAELIAEYSMARFRPVLLEGVPVASAKYLVDRRIAY